MLNEVKDAVRGAAREAALHLPPIRRLVDDRAKLTHERASIEAERDALAHELAERSAELGSGGHQAGVASASMIRVEYPMIPKVRDWSGTAGGNALGALIAQGDGRYHELLSDVRSTAAALAELTVDALGERSAVPHWDNGWFPPIDGIMLSHLLATERPRTYLEIGSGNSTKFARHTIALHGLETVIVSIDPQPRAEIDAICDRVIRSGLESDETLSAFRDLVPGDVVFLDGSHYCFQNSDVTAFFVELLPEIPRNCPYGIHDIFLPDDYPEGWLDRYYNEQYVLAAWLLGGAGGDEILLPGWYVSSRPEFAGDVQALLDLSGAGPERHGGAFWLRRH